MTAIIESKLTKHQVKTYGPKFFEEHGKRYSIVAEVRYDDECGNGHNSFGITATIKNVYGREEMGGCCHDEVAKHFPELAPFIKWHLCGSDGPMHYVANTLYHAGNRDHNGRTKGERYHVKGREEKRIVFGDFPITFEYKDNLIAFIESAPTWATVQPVEVAHEKEPKTFGSKWTLTGLDCQWYQCPFDRREEADEFLAACKRFVPQVKIFQDKFTRIGEGKERDLNAARHCAVWPEATDEQLCSEPEELKRLLLERLPALLEEFKTAVESLGFTF